LYWILGLDLFGNFALLFGAFALYKADRFSWQDPRTKKLLQDLVIVTLGFGFLCCFFGGPQRHPSVYVFLTAPGQILASIAFVAFAGPVWALCGYYAVLQVPAYHAYFIAPLTQTADTPLDTRHLFKVGLAVGKAGFVLLMLSLALNFANNNQAQEGEMHKRLVRASIGVLFLSLLFSVALLLLKLRSLGNALS
jgi:hypothetical protein